MKHEKHESQTEEINSNYELHSEAVEQLVEAMQEETPEYSQEELEAKEFTTTSGGGAVSVTANGKREIIKLDIDKDVVDPDDVEMLQDLIIAAVNEAMRQIDETSNDAMGQLTGGLNIPGLF